jgi:16S rRNA (uracil1498-N3)-methyltransferase
MTTEEEQSIQAPYRASEQKHHLKNELIKGNDVTILIGPEGDFSPAEIEWALQNGYRPISLGAARLRTETAAVVACCMAVQQE